MDQPGIDEEINYPIAASDSSQPTSINLDSSGLCCSSRTEVLNRGGLVYSNKTLMDHDGRPTSPPLHTCPWQDNTVSHLTAYLSLLSAHLVDCHVGFNLLW